MDCCKSICTRPGKQQQSAITWAFFNLNDGKMRVVNAICSDGLRFVLKVFKEKSSITILKHTFWRHQKKVYYFK